MKLKRISTKWDIMNCVVVSVDLPHVNLIGLAFISFDSCLICSNFFMLIFFLVIKKR